MIKSFYQTDTLNKGYAAAETSQSEGILNACIDASSAPTTTPSIRQSPVESLPHSSTHLQIYERTLRTGRMFGMCTIIVLTVGAVQIAKTDHSFLGISFSVLLLGVAIYGSNFAEERLLKTIRQENDEE